MKWVLMILLMTLGCQSVERPVLYGDEIASKPQIKITGKIENLDKEILVLASRVGVVDSIFIVIDSPGGRMDTTLDFLHVMDVAKRSGVVINCVANPLAGSAAFIIFANCTNRYVYANSELMFHSVGTQVYNMRVTELVAKTFYERFKKANIVMHNAYRDLMFTDEMKELLFNSAAYWNAGDYINKYGDHWMGPILKREEK